MGSGTTTSGNGYIIAATPTAALSVGADGLSLTATLTNTDLSAATANSVTSSGITGLTLGSMTANGGQTTDSCTAIAGSTASFYAKAAVTNKTTSADSNTAEIPAAATPTVSFISATTDSVTFRLTNNDTSAGTVYATFNGSTQNTGSIASGAYVDKTWTGVTTTNLSTSNVYCIVSGKIKSANATNASASLKTEDPSVVYSRENSSTTAVAFIVTQNDSTACTIS